MPPQWYGVEQVCCNFNLDSFGLTLNSDLVFSSLEIRNERKTKGSELAFLPKKR